MTLTGLRQREPTGSVLSDRVLEAYFNQPPARDPKSVSPLTARLVIWGLILAAFAVAGGLYVLDTRPVGPAHPESWDPRVAPYVAVVERARGEKFPQPVYVDFLTDTAFTAALSADPLQLPPNAGRADAPETWGYYSFEDQRIRVRGDSLTPPVASMLVQELTHALQDQRLGVGLHLDLLRDDTTAMSAFRSVLEADTRRVETAWRKTLDEGTRGALDSGRPSALRDFGQAMVTAVYRTGGKAAVDDLLRRPPTTEEHLLDPWTLVEDRQGAVPVRQPRLDDSDRSLGAGTFGAIHWLLLLERHIPAAQALGAALGWGGDAYQVFERGDGRTCLKIDYAGDTPTDVHEMSAALRAWARRAPTGSRVSRKGPLVRFETCGASAPAELDAPAVTQAVRLALAQTRLTTSLLHANLRPTEARCAASRLVRAFTLDVLDDLSLEGPRARPVVAACRGV